MNPYISVIIPTINRSVLLNSVLESLKQQTFSEKNYEIIVVDNGSTDNTKEITIQHAANNPNIKYFFCPEPGLHIGRHKGLKESKGEILVFIDDDIEATPTWLASIASCFKDAEVGMVGGNNFPRFASKPPDWLLKMWNNNKKNNMKIIPSLSIIEIDAPEQDIDPMLIWGCNFAVRKQIIHCANGFHPDGMPEHLIKFRGDGESHISQFVKQSKYRAVFHPGASVFHLVSSNRMTHNYFRKRSFSQGISDSYTFLRANLASPRFQNFARMIHNMKKMLELTLKKIKALLTADKEIRKVRQMMISGYKEGYIFHQKQYQLDKEVRAWVHKDNYL